MNFLYTVIYFLNHFFPAIAPLRYLRLLTGQIFVILLLLCLLQFLQLLNLPFRYFCTLHIKYRQSLDKKTNDTHDACN